jgi:SAM-dependent methyltransferase
MHLAAFQHAMACCERFGPWASVVEIGALCVNGGVRGLLRGARYTGIDLRAGPGVDLVADGAVWQPPEPVACVICLEVLEHAEHPRAVVENALRMLRPGGVLILSAAGPNRAPHGWYGQGVTEGESYQAIYPDDLHLWLAGVDHEVTESADGADVYAWAKA